MLAAFDRVVAQGATEFVLVSYWYPVIPVWVNPQR
jgi:hypothetical protein